VQRERAGAEEAEGEEVSLHEWMQHNEGAHWCQQKPDLKQVPWEWPEVYDEGAVVVAEGEAAQREMKEWHDEVAK
jgi:hypothetical protein